MADKPDADTAPEEPGAKTAAEAPAEGAPEAEAAADAQAAADTDAPAEADAESTPDAEQQEAEAPAAAANEGPAAAEAETQAAEEAPAEAAEEAPADAPSEVPAEAEAQAADEPGAQAGSEGESAAPARQAQEELPPKQRRRLARSRHSGEVRPPRSPEQRHAERLAERATKAARRRARRSQERGKAASASGAAQRADAVAERPEPLHAAAAGKRKVRQGIVVSDRAEKTIVVRIDVVRRHRRYEKIVRSSNTLHAHDENNDAREGDVVRVIESRPLSRTKRWRLVEVLERAQ